MLHVIFAQNFLIKTVVNIILSQILCGIFGLLFRGNVYLQVFLHHIIQHDCV
jgi:hypothetical protein